MKKLLAASLATATLALTACGAEPQVDTDEVDPTFEGEGDMSSSVGAGALTDAIDGGEAGADGLPAGAAPGSPEDAANMQVPEPEEME